MSIEIKQMIIKSTLVSEPGEPKAAELAVAEIERMQERVIEECKALIEQSLGESRER